MSASKYGSEKLLLKCVYPSTVWNSSWLLVYVRNQEHQNWCCCLPIGGSSVPRGGTVCANRRSEHWTHPLSTLPTSRDYGHTSHHCRDDRFLWYVQQTNPTSRHLNCIWKIHLKRDITNWTCKLTSDCMTVFLDDYLPLIGTPVKLSMASLVLC